MTNLEHIISTSAAIGAARAMEALGLTSGEISQRQALKIYGSWFRDALAAHRLTPVRVEDGRAGTRWFRVVEILNLKLGDRVRAELRQPSNN